MYREQDKIEMTVPAKAEYVGVVRLAASGVANRAGYTFDEIEDIKVAIAEACTNVVDHAYKDEGVITIRCNVHEDFLEFVIADSGTGANNEQLTRARGPINAEAPIQELKEGGLGLFLIEALMDEVETRNGNGVSIIMRKYLQRDGVVHRADGLGTSTINEKG